jgi:hypothetical protein
MRNGFVVIGKSAPLDPANFNDELGRKFSYEDCIRQLWPLYAFSRLETARAGEEVLPEMQADDSAIEWARMCEQTRKEIEAHFTKVWDGGCGAFAPNGQAFQTYGLTGIIREGSPRSWAETATQALHALKRAILDGHFDGGTLIWRTPPELDMQTGSGTRRFRAHARLAITRTVLADSDLFYPPEKP